MRHVGPDDHGGAVVEPVLSLSPGCWVELAAQPGGTAAIHTPKGPVRLHNVSAVQSQSLRALTAGVTEAELFAALPLGELHRWLRRTLRRLIDVGIVTRDYCGVAKVAVIGNMYRPLHTPMPPDAGLRLSRFAYLHQHGGAAVLESPLARVSVTFSDWRGPAILGLICAERTDTQIDWPYGIDPKVAQTVVEMLYSEGFLEVRSQASELKTNSHWHAPEHSDEEQQALAEWSFHDLLFHFRSRSGMHRNPYGATVRDAESRAPLPAVKPRGDGAFSALPKPDLDWLREHDLPFADVAESRESIRQSGEEPLTLEQLGHFLYRSARVRELFDAGRDQLSSRPYPGGGARYELEVYCLVSRVTGLESGLYHYDPLEHGLELLSVSDEAAQALLRPSHQPPDVMILITARIMRLTSKYESIPYSLALKDLGVLLQTFYLTGAAMGLATCAMGGGSAISFGHAAGVSSLVEPHIGEFWLNGRNPAVQALHSNSESGTVER